MAYYEDLESKQAIINEINATISNNSLETRMIFDILNEKLHIAVGIDEPGLLAEKDRLLNENLELRSQNAYLKKENELIKETLKTLNELADIQIKTKVFYENRK